MTEKKRNISEEKVRIPPALMTELRRIKGEAQLRGEVPPDFGGLLLEAWQKAKSMPDLRDQQPTENSQLQQSSSTAEIRVLSDDPVLNVVTGQKPQWAHEEEHDALDEILDSGHPVAPDAIRKNMVAFRELVQRWRGEKQPLRLPGPEHLSPEEVERIREQNSAAQQLARDAARDQPQHRAGGKRRGRTQERVG